jgi:hypothetical protein
LHVAASADGPSTTGSKEVFEYLGRCVDVELGKWRSLREGGLKEFARRNPNVLQL